MKMMIHARHAPTPVSITLLFNSPWLALEARGASPSPFVPSSLNRPAVFLEQPRAACAQLCSRVQKTACANCKESKHKP